MLVVVIAFPLLAIKLRNTFVARKWVLLNIGIVLAGSYVISCVFWYYAGASSILDVLIEAVFLSIFIFIVGIILITPAMFVWLRVARKFHNTYEPDLSQ